MESYFINKAFDEAISNYMNNLDKSEGVIFNSFLVVFIRMLVNIYGYNDIVTPYKEKNENKFYVNLMKYGAKKENIDNLKRLVECFYTIDERNQGIKKEENIYFIEIQKRVIDLYNLKRVYFNVSEDEKKEFFDLLYTPKTSNALRLSYNFLNAENIYEIAEYYKEAMNIKIENKKSNNKDLLGFNIYEFFNISISDLSNMNEKDVKKLNKEIYRTLHVREDDPNKNILLEERIKTMKNYNEPLTTGNGYVDILLIMSIIVTGIMALVIFSSIIF